MHNADVNIKLCNDKILCDFLEGNCYMIDYQSTLRDITKRLKAIRISKKLTVQEVAYRCDIERSNLSRIETGKINITLKTLCLICNALEIRLSDVLK